MRTDDLFGVFSSFLSKEGAPVTNAVLSEKVVCVGLFDNDVCICTSRRSFLGLLFQAYSGYLFRASAAVSRSERLADQRFSRRVLTASRSADFQPGATFSICFRPLPVIGCSTSRPRPPSPTATKPSPCTARMFRTT